MINPNGQNSPARRKVARLGFGLGIAFVSACSGEFPVGDFGERGALLDGNPSTASETAGSNRVDGTLPAALPEPDVSAELDALLGFGSITPVGDLDGDGKNDVAITAANVEHGYVLVRYGGQRLPTSESASEFVNTGARLLLPGDGFVMGTVAAAGDVDGDGFDDLLVVDSLCDPTLPADGAFLVYGGPERLDGTRPLTDVSAHFARPTFPGEPEGACPVQPAFSAGDLDGDGRADLVLAAPPPLGANGLVFGQDEGLYLFYGRAERFSGEIPLTAADARLNAPIVLDQLMSGDINGDGLGDLITGSFYVGDVPDGVIYVPGRADRWSGLVDLQTQAVPLDGALMVSSPNTPQFGDLNGDGLSDVLLLDEASQLQTPPPQGAVFHLFYGTPGLFGSGIDFSQANAQLLAASSFTLLSAGDRDGDGDDEIIDSFAQVGSAPSVANVALVSGSRQRISGALTVPEAEVAAQNAGSLQLDIFQLPVATDLEGDGASDVITVTTLYDDENIPTATRLNFHYGTLAPETAVQQIR